MKIIITGATGMVGAETLRQAIADDSITEVTAIVRKPLTLQHSKVKTILHQNFNDYSGLSEVFKNNDAFVWALGISQSQVSKAEYEVITFDYTMAAAKAMNAANPDLIFLFVSGEGADVTEKSRTIFARIKGKAENALMAMKIKNLCIVRPGGIQPITPNPNMPFVYKLFLPLFPVMKLIYPSMVITSVQLGKVILKIIKQKGNTILFRNKDLLQLLKNN